MSNSLSPAAATAHEWLLANLQSLADHEERTGPAPSTRFCVEAAVTSAGLQLEVWWREVPSLAGSEFRWDARQFEGAGAAELAEVRQATPGHIGGKPIEWSEGAWTPRPAPTLVPPLFQYHPQRLRMLTPFARALSAMSNRCQAGMRMEDVQAIGNMYFAAVQSAQLTETKSLRERVAADQLDKRTVMRGIELYAMYVHFEGAGRAIFDFPPLMSEMFDQTDIDQVPVNTIKLPYSTQYLHFGPQEGTEIRPGWKLEGAYVQRDILGTIRILVTATPPSVEAYQAIDVAPEPIYSQSIPESMADLSLGDAVEGALARTMDELRKQVNNTEFAQGALAVGSVSRMAAAAAQELEGLAVKHAAYLKVLRLVVNGLCYLTGYPDDIKAQWPDSTPLRLKEQATSPSSKHKQRQSAASKLLAMGYTPVHMCGQKFEEQMAAEGNSPRALSAEERKGYTWVRGHYLRQAHGPGMSLRKLQWRMPRLARMRKDLGDLEPTGHLYLVTSASA